MGRGGQIDEYNKHRNNSNINTNSNWIGNSSSIFFSVLATNNLCLDRN